GVVAHPYEEFGYDAMAEQGLSREEAVAEVTVRAVQALSVTAATVPDDFPVGLADRLRALGVELRPDYEVFARRRRVKTPAELEGIRRAQRAAEAGMRAAADLLRRGGELTSEQLKAALAEQFVAHGCVYDEAIASHGPQTAVGHDFGSGR